MLRLTVRSFGIAPPAVPAAMHSGSPQTLGGCACPAAERKIFWAAVHRVPWIGRCCSGVTKVRALAARQRFKEPVPQLLESIYSTNMRVLTNTGEGAGGEGAFKEAEGTGMGEGQGAKDVSDQIEDQDQLLGAQQKDAPPEEPQEQQVGITAQNVIVQNMGNRRLTRPRTRTSCSGRSRRTCRPRSPSSRQRPARTEPCLPLVDKETTRC